MKVKFEKSVPNGEVNIPASKSVLHRALFCAMLSNGRSVLHGNFKNLCDDVKATIECMQAFGVSVDVNDDSIVIERCGELLIPKKLNAYESATTFRFFAPLCMTYKENTDFYFSESMLLRPQTIYDSISYNEKIPFEKYLDHYCIGGKLEHNNFTVLGRISSQFISGLLLISPLIGGIKIKIVPPIASKPYIDLTISVMKSFGVSVSWIDDNTLFVDAEQKYVSCDFCHVESDWSSAAYFEFYKALGYNVNVPNMNCESAQSDRVCTELFEILKNEECNIDVSDCPDLALLLFAYSAINKGGRFKGISRLKYKESDRLNAMIKILQKFGVTSEIVNDELIIHKSDIIPCDDVIDTYKDHRLVMTASLLCSLYGGTINGAENVTKSFPDFFANLENLKVKLSKE